MLIARFSEHERYDINDDCHKVTLVATTPRGSYFTEFVKGTTSELRESRRKFKEFTAKCMYEGVNPGEVDLDD
jgi:hypothetical protein